MVVRGQVSEEAVPAGEAERSEELVQVDNVVIEHIASPQSGAATRYEQAHDEWVMVLSGGATLDVDGERCQLGPGDWVLLPGRVPHTVLSTAAGTRWLAVHVHPSQVTR